MHIHIHITNIYTTIGYNLEMCAVRIAIHTATVLCCIFSHIFTTTKLLTCVTTRVEGASHNPGHLDQQKLGLQSLFCRRQWGDLT